MKMWTLLFLSIIPFCFADDAAIQQFTTANNLFTPSAYKEIVKSEKGNFLVSPFSAETVLAFAQSGSKGKSGEELRTALHLPNDKNAVESAVKSLLPKFKSNNLYSLHTANKIYVKENFPIKTEFKNAANSVYQADSENIDFTKNVEAAKTINDWVEKHTNNKIKNLVESADLDENTRAILINALHFKANWSNPFSLLSTQKQKFYKTPTQEVQVDTLNHRGEYFKYYECPHLEAQFVELPFIGEEASLVVVLPNKKDGLSGLEGQLEQVFSPQHELKTTYLNVALPKFKIETKIDFISVLQKLGVKKVFNAGEADLSGISGDPGDLYIAQVVQKTFIDVSEEGVEAAAATLVSVSFTSSGFVEREQPKNFIVDHPFIFYIKVKDLIIFAGRVTDPSKA